MELRFQYTLEDYSQAMSYHAKDQKELDQGQWPAMIATCTLSFAFLVPLLMLMIFHGSETRQNRSVHDLAVGWVCGIGFCFLLGFGLNVFKQRMLVRKLWEGQSHLHDPHTVTITDDGITVRQASRRSEYMWATFQKYRSTPELFLLYTSEYQYVMIPRRSFETPADLAGFQMQCEDYLGGVKRGFPMLPGPPPLQT